mmetsp:Transcript_17586/g.27608  ORF Transcript_17586/g.27608 Transcript_17586/m.27608 type:complete len:223 (+) Transcript_17586:2399-3067(+)
MQIALLVVIQCESPQIKPSRLPTNKFRCTFLVQMTAHCLKLKRTLQQLLSTTIADAFHIVVVCVIDIQHWHRCLVPLNLASRCTSQCHRRRRRLFRHKLVAVISCVAGCGWTWTSTSTSTASRKRELLYFRRFLLQRIWIAPQALIAAVITGVAVLREKHFIVVVIVAVEAIVIHTIGEERVDDLSLLRSVQFLFTDLLLFAARDQCVQSDISAHRKRAGVL